MQAQSRGEQELGFIYSQCCSRQRTPRSGPRLMCSGSAGLREGGVRCRLGHPEGYFRSVQGLRTVSEEGLRRPRWMTAGCTQPSPAAPSAAPHLQAFTASISPSTGTKWWRQGGRRHSHAPTLNSRVLWPSQER